MNYLKYNNIYTIPYQQLQTLKIKDQTVFFEFVVDSMEIAKNHFLFLKNDLNYNMEVFFQNEYYFNFKLNNCYFENNLIILEGENYNE